MMQHNLPRALLALVSASLLFGCGEAPEPNGDGSPAPSTLRAPLADGPTAAPKHVPSADRYIVSFLPGKGAQGRAALTAAGAQMLLEIGGLDAVAARIPSRAVAGLQRNPAIEYIEPDAVRYLNSNSADTTTGSGPEIMPYGIPLVQADQVAYGGDPITVCIIDSGYLTEHEDLQDVGVTFSYDSGTGDPEYDDNGHGTHVAGTIAALGDNGTGVRGVVKDGSLHLHIVKVFTAAGWAYSSNLAVAAQNCADAGARIISMSLGGSVKNKTEERKFNQLNGNGILSIAAAGNDGNNRHNYPASYSSVVSVAAVDSNSVVADFSQYTSQVELAAPGVGVTSTTPFVNTATVTVNGVTYGGLPIEFAALGTATGALVDGGLCDSVGAGWSGKIVHCRRGDISFYDKVHNAELGGATGVVVSNNDVGELLGTLGEGNTSTIPAIGVTQDDGDALATAAASSPAAQVVNTSSFPDSGYESWDGTSMATPHVSGVAALVWSWNAGWTNTQIRQALTATAKDLGAAGRDVYYGYGLVQARDALVYLDPTWGGGPVDPPANQSPIAQFSFDCVELDCTFDGSGSYDPDGSIASWSWSFGASGASASHSFASSGTYSVTLTVTDDEGATATATKSVTVSDAAPGTLEITNVGGSPLGGRSFRISWTTNIAADSLVTFTHQNGVAFDPPLTFPDATLVTSHAMDFNGSKNVTYTYTVTSEDAGGNSATSGPYTYTN